jgi:hypothetical protein
MCGRALSGVGDGGVVCMGWGRRVAVLLSHADSAGVEAGPPADLMPSRSSAGARPGILAQSPADPRRVPSPRCRRRGAPRRAL